MRSWACWAISAPWSQVKDRRSCSGRVLIVSAIAPRTASAPCPANAGPFLTRGWSPWPSMAGRCSSSVNRVVRSTSVPIAELLGAQDRDLFSFGERQVSARLWGQGDRWHPTSLPEPSRADRRRHAGLHRGVLARQAASDRLPEADSIHAPCGRRPTRRPHLATHRPDPLLLLAHTHPAPPPYRGVATTS